LLQLARQLPDDITAGEPPAERAPRRRLNLADRLLAEVQGLPQGLRLMQVPASPAGEINASIGPCRGPDAPGATPICFLVSRLDGHQIKAQLPSPLDQIMQLRLVDHRTGQYRVARTLLYPHPFEQEPERSVKLAADNYAVSFAFPIVVHSADSYTQAGVKAPPSAVST
jgi:hypothetical protein